jgi:hypothetical protein
MGSLELDGPRCDSDSDISHWDEAKREVAEDTGSPGEMRGHASVMGSVPPGFCLWALPTLPESFSLELLFRRAQGALNEFSSKTPVVVLR